jgi:hypothetical protein
VRQDFDGSAGQLHLVLDSVYDVPEDVPLTDPGRWDLFLGDTDLFMDGGRTAAE